MARGRPKAPTQAENLLKALDFIKVGSGDLEDWHKFVSLSGNFAISSNGQIAAGHPIEEELTLCPQLGKLEATLKRCGKKLVISESANNRLTITGEKIKAVVPCVLQNELPYVAPDQQIATVDDRIKEAFKICVPLANENATRCCEASLLLEANTVTSTNGKTILQYWHGIDLPPQMAIPKLFAQAIARQSLSVTGAGFSWQENGKARSITIYFENGAWIKTLCYFDEWPNVNQVLNVETNPSEPLEGLFEGVEAIVSFSDDEYVTLGDGEVLSHDDNGVGAQYVVKGLQGGKKFKGDDLKKISNHISTLDLNSYSDRAYFFGGTPDNPIRGAIIGIATTVTRRES